MVDPVQANSFFLNAKTFIVLFSSFVWKLLSKIMLSG